MRRILLLDDSANIQKVVKLTFSSDANCEVKIARTETEAQAALAEARPDAVIAYVHFPKGDIVSYFLGVRDVCPNILLLAESDVDVGSLVSAGFHQILRKPFVSAKLRSDVLSFWGETAPESGLPVPNLPPPPPPPPNLRTTVIEPSKTSASMPPPPPPPLAAEVPPIPPPPVAKASPPPPPPPISFSLGADAVTQLEVGYGASTPPPPPPFAAPSWAQPEPQTFEAKKEDEKISPQVPANLFRTATFAPVDVPSISETGDQQACSPGVSITPEITMDLGTLEQTFRDTVAGQGVSESQSVSAPEISFSVAVPQEISLDLSMPTENIEIEDLRVRNKPNSGASASTAQTLPGDWRREMNEAIDDAVFRIIDRALPTRIDSKIVEVMPNIDEVVNNLRNEVSAKLMEALRAQVVGAVQKWLKENLQVIAREEVRSEIQKIITEI